MAPFPILCFSVTLFSVLSNSKFSQDLFKPAVISAVTYGQNSAQAQAQHAQEGFRIHNCSLILQIDVEIALGGSLYKLLHLVRCSQLNLFFNHFRITLSATYRRIIPPYSEFVKSFRRR